MPIGNGFSDRISKIMFAFYLDLCCVNVPSHVMDPGQTDKRGKQEGANSWKEGVAGKPRSRRTGATKKRSGRRRDEYVWTMERRRAGSTEKGGKIGGGGQRINVRINFTPLGRARCH